jgi:hypothetical protein
VTSERIKPAFVDVSYASEMLRVPLADLLDMVSSGRLRTFGGPPKNPFVRLTDVEAIAEERGAGLEQPPVRRRATDDPAKRVALRLRHDARWNTVDTADIDLWSRTLTKEERLAAISVGRAAIERLAYLVKRLESSPSPHREEQV